MTAESAEYFPVDAMEQCVLWIENAMGITGMESDPDLKQDVATVKLWLARQLADAKEGEWVPMRHDDPYNDGPVWLDENGRLCWAGAGGETKCLVLHGDMAVCLWRPKVTP